MKPLLVLLRSVSRPELAARPVRSLLVVGAIATGVALLTGMRVATDTIVSGFTGDLERLGGRADLQVTFGTGEAGFPEEVAERLAGRPFVAEAAALVHSRVTFEDGERETVELFGIDLLQRGVLDLYEVEVLARDKEDFAILDDPRALFVTDTVAARRGLALGSRVRLSAVDGTHSYTVRGIVATKGLAAFLGGRLVAMYLPASQPVAGRQGDLAASMVDQVDLRLREGASVEEARRELQAMLGPGYVVATPLQRRLAGSHTVEGLRATLVGMSTLALLAAVFLVYASTTTMVAERLPAMATLSSIGAAPGVLAWAVAAEAAILGLAGSLVGTAVGLLLASYIGRDAAAGMGLNYSLPFDAGRVWFDPWVVLLAHPVGGTAVAAWSAWLPARRLRTLAPLVLMRDQPRDESRSWSPMRLVAAACVPLATGAAALAIGVSRTMSTWVSAGGVLIVAGGVLLMLPVLGVVWEASAAWLARTAGAAGRIAGENLLRSRERSLVVASAIMLSVAIAVGAGSLVESFRGSVSTWYGFSGDALVSSRSVMGGWIAAPVSRDLEEHLRHLPSVAGIETLRVLQGQPHGGERIAMAALSPGLVRAAMRRGARILAGSAEEAAAEISSGRALAVSQNFVAHFGLPAAGGRLRLAAVTGELALPVVSVVPDYVSDMGSVLVSPAVLASGWGDEAVNYFAVDLAVGATVAALERDVGGLGDLAAGIVVVPTTAMIERVDSLIHDAFSDIDTIKLLVLLLTAVGVADLVVSNVLARRRDLAVLTLVGLPRSGLVRMARLEGFCVAAGAATCGVLVGALCAWVWVRFNYPALVGYVLELELSWTSVAASLLLACAAAWFTAAARFALSTPALSAIRSE